jgi:hypothetical protein
VILAYGDLTLDGTVTKTLTDSEWAALHAYEADFGVREVEWYANPYWEEGFGATTGANPVTGTLTPAATGAGAPFSYLKPGASITIAQWTVLAQATDPAIVKLLVDASGNALVSTRLTADLRETMKVTFASNFADVHGLVLAHGYIEWLTKGVYLGHYRATLSPQIDDYFIPDEIFPVNPDACVYNGQPACVCDGSLQACKSYLMTIDDLKAVLAWQGGIQATDPGFRLAMAFNGQGAVLTGTDKFTEATRAAQASFLWINHTYGHLNLGKTIGRPDVIQPTDTKAFEVTNNFSLNETVAKSVGLANYRSSRIVSPDVSGLSNPEALLALGHAGVRYMITDASVPGWNNPTPNVGMYSAFQRNIYLVPRRASNLFYDVSTPTEWKDQYDALYANKPVSQGGAGGVSSVDQILDRESNNLLTYLLRGDADPLMFHQANLRAYTAGKTLLGDLIDATLTKYRTYSTLPIHSPDLDVVAERMKVTGERNAAGVVATLTPGVSVTFTSPKASRVAFSRDLAAPACATAGGESYATKCITTLSVPANGTVTLPLP